MIAVLSFHPHSKVPPALKALRTCATPNGHVAVEVTASEWPTITNAWPGWPVTIAKSGTEWHGPITSDHAGIVERAVKPWASA